MEGLTDRMAELQCKCFNARMLESFAMACVAVQPCCRVAVLCSKLGACSSEFNVQSCALCSMLRSFPHALCNLTI